MQILRPNSTFKIVWQISVPGDSTTYYPQAVIRKSLDGSLLDTVNLTLESTGRYSANWIVPGDASGLGTQIDITVIAYTDSGHTTASQNYSEENVVYNIFDLLGQVRAGGGIDYLEVQKIVAREIGKAVGALVIPDHTQPIGKLGAEVKGLAEALGEVNDSIGGITNNDVLEALSGHTDVLKKEFGAIPSVGNDINSKAENRHGLMLEGIQNLAEQSGRDKEAMAELMSKVMSAIDAHEQKIGDLGLLVQQAMAALKGLNRAFMNIDSVTLKRERGLQIPDQETPAAKKDYEKIAKLLSQ